MAETNLNMKLLLRRADFADSCVLAAGEPSYNTRTKVFKIGDGATLYKDLPFANEGNVREILANYYTKTEVDQLLAGYKPLQSAIAAVETAANTFVDTVAQDANGKITITTKAVDFSGLESVYKKIQTALTVNASAKNTFVDTIAQDTQGVITVTFKAVDFSDYRTAADQDTIDANFKTKQTAVNKTGDTLKTVTAVTQDENGEIDVTFADIKTGAAADGDTGLITGDTLVHYVEGELDSLKSAIEGDAITDTETSETIAGAKKYADARKAEVVEMIDGVASAGLTRSIVTALPNASEAALNTIYMVKREAGLDNKDVYDEYIVVEVEGAKQFELLGNTELDLTGYATENYADNAVENAYKLIQGSKADSLASNQTEGEWTLGGLFNWVNSLENGFAAIPIVVGDELGAEGADEYLKVETTNNGNGQSEFASVKPTERLIDAVALAESAIQDVSGKADIVEDATAGNLASLDANGNLADSGESVQGLKDYADNAVSEFEKTLGTMAKETANDYVKVAEFSAYEQTILGDELGGDPVGSADKYVTVDKYKSGINYAQIKLTEYASTRIDAVNDLSNDLGALADRVDDLEAAVEAIDVGVTKVTAGADIVVTPAAGTGDVTVAHKDYSTGTLTKNPESLTKTGDAYFFNTLELSNGHVTSGSMKSLAETLMSMSFVFDGGTSAT